MQQDLNYAVSELAFTEPSTRDKACGWLCRSPRRRLKTNVVAPEVGVDCRLTVSTGKCDMLLLPFIYNPEGIQTELAGRLLEDHSNTSCHFLNSVKCPGFA